MLFYIRYLVIYYYFIFYFSLDFGLQVSRKQFKCPPGKELKQRRKKKRKNYVSLPPFRRSNSSKSPASEEAEKSEEFWQISEPANIVKKKKSLWETR